MIDSNLDSNQEEVLEEVGNGAVSGLLKSAVLVLVMTFVGAVLPFHGSAPEYIVIKKIKLICS